MPNLASEIFSEMSIKIFWNFIDSKVSIFNICNYFIIYFCCHFLIFDNVLDLIGQRSLYVLSTARARNSITVVQLSDPKIWSRIIFRRLVMVESLFRRYFIFVFCWKNFFVNRFRFRINNGRWSETSEIRIPETNWFGLVINILSIKVTVGSDRVVGPGLVIIGMRELERKRKEKKKVYSNKNYLILQCLHT